MKNAVIRLSLVALAAGLFALLLGLMPRQHPEIFGCQHHVESRK